MILDYRHHKMVKMGHWSLRCLDSENWHAEVTSANFYKIFGFYKGTTALHEISKGLQHCYFPQYFFDKIYAYITKVNKKDYRSLAKILLKFYDLKKIAKREIPKIRVSDYRQLSNRELVKLYKKNRDWAHRVTVYDQFGWIAEEYWEPYMSQVLSKLGVARGSSEYNRILFILTKAQEISTTLEEKRDTILAAYKIKIKQQTIKQASKLLVKKYAWMPVFTFGVPWDEKYYEQQLAALIKKKAKDLWAEYQVLVDYKKIQQQDIKDVLREYKIKPRDLQLFFDFGLALDARNEAEYLVSLAGFYLLPIYKEIARRLYISVTQLRNLFEKEVEAALLSKLDVQDCLNKKGEIVGWGFNYKMDKRFNLSPAEAAKLFKHLEKHSLNLQGHDEERGKCASPGKVTGRVKIIDSPAENSKVKDGDILVCHATTVDYLPAMKRAVAFVTEVGGLTCHAAVVAREFGVPCIVSLKNATKNLKNNSLVELNADDGTIRVIKK